MNYPIFDAKMRRLGIVVSVSSTEGHDEYHVEDENCTLHLNISNKEELEKIQCNTYYKTL